MIKNIEKNLRAFFADKGVTNLFVTLLPATNQYATKIAVDFTYKNRDRGIVMANKHRPVESKKDYFIELLANQIYDEFFDEYFSNSDFYDFEIQD